MAEALYLKAASSASRHDDVISRGTSIIPENAEPIGNNWPSSQVMMQCYGIDISQHVPKAVSSEDIAWADLILTMTKHHNGELRQEFLGKPELHLDAKMHSFGNYIGTPSSNVEDPAGKGYGMYVICAKQLESWTKSLVVKLNSHDTKTHT